MKTTRKEFLQKSATGMAGLLVFPTLFSYSPGNGKPVVVHADEGETYWIGPRNSPLTILISHDQYGNETMSLCKELIAPGQGIPPHKHLNEDELIFIHQGQGTLILNDQEFPVKEGSAALVPKGTWHQLTNTGMETLNMVFSYSPAGFEGYFRELGSPVGTPWQPKTTEEFATLDKKWGIVYK